jgi:hypothetical protein
MPLNQQRVQAVFLEAAGYRDLANRAALLDHECMGDFELRKRLEALLRAHDRFNDFCNQPLVGPDGRISELYAFLRSPRRDTIS